MREPVIDLVANQAAGFGLAIRKRTGSGLELDVPIPRPDGTSPVYQIRVDAVGARLIARELKLSRLPGCCPDRHINRDGSFCLGWEEADNLDVVDDDSAELFISKLIKYLQLQERAAHKRAWPDNRAWAHGHAAAQQRAAMAAADLLGPHWGEAVRRGKLAIARRGKPGIRALRVSMNESWVYSVWETERRVVNLRRLCFASEPHAETKAPIIRECGLHRDAAVALAFALRDWEVAEGDFWKRLKGTPCCRTLDQCPLK